MLKERGKERERAQASVVALRAAIDHPTAS